MEAGYASGQPVFPDQYEQSQDSFATGSGQFGMNIDRSSDPTSSFVPSTAVSPHDAPMMAFSDSSLSDDMDFTNFVVDGDSASPMSNTLSEQEFFPSSWSTQSPQTTQGYDIPMASHRTSSSSGSFQAPHYQQALRNQGKTSQISFMVRVNLLWFSNSPHCHVRKCKLWSTRLVLPGTA
jgi:hypothetical protein